MCLNGYYTLMRESKDPRYLRLRMVQEAKRSGVKPTAGLLACSPNTVRKWLNRFDGTLDSLSELSRAPHHSPNKLCKAQEQEIVAARKKLPVWSPRRLKRDMNLPYSPNAIHRVLKEHHLLRKYRRKKHQVKRCLRDIKRKWAFCKQITADTKDLKDLPEYLIQAKALGLPLHQYTARDVSTGALFLGYADELSLTYAEAFAKRIALHLRSHGVRSPYVTWQTDNGSEFVGSWQAVEKSAFTRTIESFGSRHRTIPPGQHRFQADVETVHSLMEVEFYLERFSSRYDFIRKAQTYQHYFNYVRPNSGKENKCPFDLVKEKRLHPPLDLLYLPSVFLEDLVHQQHSSTLGVHDVQGLP
jgi:hypothetical protein